VRDGKPDSVSYGSIELVDNGFSADGKTLTYVARNHDDCSVMVNGMEVRRYSNVEELAISSDRKHVACFFWRNEQPRAKHVLIVDGKEITGYPDIRVTSFSFTPDSSHLYYTATVDGDTFTMIDQTELKRHESYASPLFFSPDGAHMYFIEDEAVLVTDGKRGRGYPGMHRSDVYFSPDGKHLAYRSRHGNDDVVLCDDHESKAYHSIKLLGNSLFYGLKKGHIVFVGEQDGKFYIVADGVESKPFDRIDLAPLNVSPTILRVLAHRGNELIRVDVDFHIAEGDAGG
jgi:Tol biopolymer transport system component